ncbi:transporter [Methylobacterium sp. R2-1]|uniref:transporter n=1 Tax=Methylobacterium sp. R2-1 TaxID=2587064 RepID=UPI00160D8CB9|nr:transporter [Methylobacterium sp. R2-1]MBB2965025.1 hypothetical protein [Methylobacterium sp. R2-1]
MKVGAICQRVVVGASLALSLIITKAEAGGTSAPGFTSGIPVWAVAPEGLYYLNQTYSGFHDVNNLSIRSNYNVFFFFWQTGAKFLGADVGAVVAPTVADVSVQGSPNEFSLFNTYLATQLSWTVAKDFYVGYRLSGYIPQGDKLSLRYGTIEHRFGASYVGDGWNLTGNFMFGTPVDVTRSDLAPNYMLADLTATKRFGNFEFGSVAHFSSDLDRPIPSYGKQSQFAVGGLIGYDFGPVYANVKVTRDIYSENRGFRDTIVWTNISFPLWVAPPAAALITK